MTGTHMRFRMPSASTRPDSSVPLFRQRVPRDVAERARGRTILIDLPACGLEPETTVAVVATGQIKFSLRCRDPAAVKARVGAALARLNQTWDAIRQGPARLSHRQVVALSGEVYQHLIDTCGDDPGEASSWAAIKAWGRAVAEGRVMAPPALTLNPRAANDEALARDAFGVDLTAGIDALERGDDPRPGLESRYGVITSWLLMRRGVEIDGETRGRLLWAVHNSVADACHHLKRNAAGDYTPDPRAARFPVYETVKPVAPALTLTMLFDRWKAEAQPAHKTLVGWAAVLKRFRAFIGHDDARKITADDVVRYKDDLLASGAVAARTINATHITVLRRIFSYAVQNRLLRDNPAMGVLAADKVRAGEGRLPYTDAEVGHLLALAGKEESPLRRWVPMILALTGARSSEITMMWADQVARREGIWCFDIRPSPDGATLKTRASERTVPIHPALIDAGFLQWVAAQGAGPLFHHGRGKVGAAHPSSVATTRLAEWVRGQGFNDPRKSPNHALRHWTKSVLHRVGVDPVTADALQGHAGKGEASTYRHFAVLTLAEAVAKIPVPARQASE